MPVNLSIKNVPDSLADRLRERAERNRRSLQRELVSILEAATSEPRVPGAGAAEGPERAGRMSIEEVVARVRKLFPEGTPSATELIREMRDARYGDSHVFGRKRGRTRSGS